MPLLAWTRPRAPAHGAVVTVAGDPDDKSDDAALVARAQAGHAPAFALLYRRYVDPVYRYCYRSLGNREAAEDATSQIFAKALAALPRYRDRDHGFRPWLFAIAHNVVVDAYRARRPDASLDVAVYLADASPSGSPEEMALAAEATRSVCDILHQLPEDQRQIVELRLAGQTGPEIAATLGRSLASVKFAQHRAYARLRSLLGVTAVGQGTGKEGHHGDR